MNQDDKKRAVARAALEFVVPGELVGVGTGSTADAFIDALATLKGRIDGAVASSETTAARLAGHGIRVVDLNSAGELAVYVDGADESTRHRHLVKGGGGRSPARRSWPRRRGRSCASSTIRSSWTRLGRFPLPIEVIPMARSFVARALVRLGGRPERREGFVTDNGNEIPGRARPRHPQSAGPRIRAEPARRHRHQRTVRAARRGRGPGRHRQGSREDLRVAPGLGAGIPLLEEDGGPRVTPVTASVTHSRHGAQAWIPGQH